MPLNKYFKIIITSVILALWVLTFYHGLITGLNFVLSLFAIIILFALIIINGILISRAESKIISFVIFLLLGLVAPALYLMNFIGR